MEHLIYYPDSFEGKLPAIVMLHGRGADADDLVPLGSYLGVDGIAVIAPRAPFPFTYGDGFAWYDVEGPKLPGEEKFRKSLDILRKFLDEAKEAYPLDPGQLILLGFSQGTVMSYATALLDPTKVKAIVALSGYIPNKSGLPLQLHDLKGLPVFISHGTSDPIIPVEYGRESAEILRKAGADVCYMEYPIGHELNSEILADLAAWMKRQFLR